MDRLKSKLDIAKGGIGEMEKRTEEIIESAAKRDKEMKTQREDLTCI